MRGFGSFEDAPHPSRASASSARATLSPLRGARERTETDRRSNTMPRLQTHPGEVLREEYFIPLGMSARALAKALGVPANRITEIMRGERDVSADTAIRLGRYFKTDPRFWLNLQSAYDLSVAVS